MASKLKLFTVLDEKILQNYIRKKKQQKRLTHIQIETKLNTKTLNKKIEQPQQQKQERNEHVEQVEKKSRGTTLRGVWIMNVQRGLTLGVKGERHLA